jgi:hypothetical protein
MISLLLVLLNFLYEILNFLNMFFSRNAQDVTSTLQCKPIYQPSDGKIQCHFTLHNNGDGPIWVSKWLTPLEGIQSNCLRVMRNGKNVRYDGILLSRRFPPPSMSYVRISSKGKVSTKFDLSKSYRINEPGIYTVSVDIKTLYFYPNFFAKENLHKRSLISPAVTFMNMQPASNLRFTTGERHRMSEMKRIVRRSGNRAADPLPPIVNVTGPTKWLKIFQEIHRAAYYYVEASVSELREDDSHFIMWFGNKSSNREIVIRDYTMIMNHLRSTEMRYIVFASQPANRSVCPPRAFASALVFTNTVYFCPHALQFQNIATHSSLDSILSTVIHELSHAINGRDDTAYGEDEARKLAKDDPSQAIINAENYAYFSITTYPFNYGIDAMTVLPNGRMYIIKENFYARLKDNFDLDYGYPELLFSKWGNLDKDFLHGFDSIFTCGKAGYTYVTKGAKYIKYTDKEAKQIAIGYPKSIKGNFGSLSSKFLNGFDSASRLPNHITYVTSGSNYARCKDDYFVSVADIKTIEESTWGKLPSAFMSGFDSMASVSGKTYVTKGKQFVRYSSKDATEVDEGYPKDIRGHFGQPRK